MSASASDRRRALDALTRVVDLLSQAERAYDEACGLRVVNSLVADGPVDRWLRRAMGRALRHAMWLRGCVAWAVVGDRDG